MTSRGPDSPASHHHHEHDADAATLASYDNWLVALSALVGVGIGAIYMVVVRPYERSDSISGDAIRGPASLEKEQR